MKGASQDVVALVMAAGMVALGGLALWVVWKLTKSLFKAGFWLVVLLGLVAAGWWILMRLPTPR